MPNSFSKLWEKPVDEISTKYTIKKGLDINTIHKLANTIDKEIVEIRDCLLHEHPLDSIYLSPDHKVKIRIKYQKGGNTDYCNVIEVINTLNCLLVNLLKVKL